MKTIKRSSRRVRTLLLIVVSSLLASIIGVRLMRSKEPAKIIYSKDYAEQLPTFDGNLKIVTWNIRYGVAIDATIEALTNNEALQEADIVLLQEMDEIGTEAIAKALNYNYVYSSATIYPFIERNYGNAILSPWPLSEGTRVALPHKDPLIGQERIATRAVVNVNQDEIQVYSIHIETVRLSWRKRLEQIEHLASDATNQQSRYVVVGGDFNIPTQRGIRLLTEHMAGHGLDWVSEGAGPTFRRAFRFWELDHIFASGLTLGSNGVVIDRAASDHFALWVQLTLEK